MKPKVLIFVDWYTPGYKAGGPVRSMVNLVEHLHQEIDFHIVTSDTEYTEQQPYPSVRSDEWNQGEHGERIYYASRSGQTKAIWKRILAQEKWTAVYVNGVYSLWYSAAPLWLSRGQGLKMIVASRGMLAPGPMQHGTLKKRLFLFAMKASGAYSKVHWQGTDQNEAEQIKKQIGANTVHVVPNLPKKQGLEFPPERAKQPGTLNIVSLARIAVEKNTHLAIESLAGLSGQVKYDMYGPVYEEGYWQACQEIIEALSENVQVYARGPVPPSSAEKLLQEAHILLMPSSGENFGHTMLEALSVGLPIVISDRTPWKALNDAHAGWDLPVEPEEEAQKVFEKKLQTFVDMDQAEYDLWSKGAFNYAKAYLSDPTPVELNRRLFE